MINANQHENDQSPANDAAKAPAQQPEQADIEKAVANAMLIEGEKEGATMMLQKHPEWRYQIVAFLHKTKGQAFVYSVLHPGDAKGLAAMVARENNNVAAGVPASEMRGEKPAEAGARLRHEDAHDQAQEAKDMASAQSRLGITMPAPPAPTAESSKDAAAPAAAGGDLKAAIETSKADMRADTAKKPQVENPAQVAPPAPNAKGPTPGPDSAEAKQAEPSPQRPNEPAPTPETEVAPPGKQDVSSASQGPAPAPPAQEAAPKNEEKAAEKGKDEKPEEKVDTEVTITASALRVRAAGSLTAAVIGKIPRGGKAHVVGHEGSWLKIKWGGGGGHAFIHSKYTTAVKGNESGEEEEHQGEESSHEQKQERPKAPPMVNDDQQKAVV